MNNCDDEIYRSITKKEIIKIFLVGGIIGAFIFVLCYGWKILDVTYDSWLFTGSDITQHYIGWKFYRAADWTFPIGMMDNILYPSTSCIIFTDSIPLFAIFFKLFSPILPETFQYFGIWGIFSYFMMGALAAMIVRKSTKSQILCYMGSVIFAFSPYVAQRMFAHTALAGHWILLIGIFIWIYKPYFSTFKRKLLAWGIALITGSLIHIYFVPMILVLMFGFCLQDVFEKCDWKADLVIAPVCIIFDLIVLYVVGAFSTGGFSDGPGLGKYSANVNSLINSNNRTLLLNPLPILEGQDEGFGYLGLGIILVLAISLILIINKYIKIKRQKNILNQYKTEISYAISMFVVVIIFLVLAWSPTIVLGERVLFTIEYPAFVLKILNIFRASGRFMWPVSYLLMFFSIMSIVRYCSSRIQYGIICGALLIQVIDMSSLTLNKQWIGNQPSQFVTIQDRLWEELAKDREHVIILPYSTVRNLYGLTAWYEIGNFAVDHGMKVSSFPAARLDYDLLTANDNLNAENTRNGSISKDSLYILDSVERGEELGLEVFCIDSYNVGVRKQYK